MDMLEVAAGQPADQIEDVGMIAERAATKTIVALGQGNPAAVAQLGHALPRKRPDRREGDIRRLHRPQFSDGPLGHQPLDPLDDRIVVQFQLDLADHAGTLHQFDHAVVLAEVECRDLHGENMNTALGRGAHLAEVLTVCRGQHGGFDLGMPVEHFFFVPIAGHALYSPAKSLFDRIVLRTSRHPVELRRFLERLEVLARVSVGQREHGDFQGFHERPPFTSRRCWRRSDS